MPLFSSQMSQAVHPISNSNSNGNGGICLFAFTSFPSCSLNSWIVDFRATSHITCSMDPFTPTVWYHDRFVVLPNHSKIPVVASSDVSFSPCFTIYNVLYLPTFKVNLISVSFLLQHEHFGLIFSSHGFVIQDLWSSKMIGKGNLVQGLCVFEPDLIKLQETVAPTNSLLSCNFVDNNSSDVYCTYKSNNVSAKTWHNRLGHVSFKVLKDLSNKIACQLPSPRNSLFWDICPLSKQCRLAFTSHKHIESEPFTLIHWVIWGPYHTPTYHGQRYFLTLVDDHSHFTWTFLFSHKSELAVTIQKFFLMVETQFNKKVKAFRSDNAHELALFDFLASQGTLH